MAIGWKVLGPRDGPPGETSEAETCHLTKSHTAAIYAHRFSHLKVNGFLGINRGTVRSEILIASFCSSPWNLGLPQVGFALAILRTKSRMSLPVPGRPAPFRFERHFHYNANPFRCHRTTVSGLTTMRDSRHFCQIAERQAREKRSRFLSRG